MGLVTIRHQAITWTKAMINQFTESYKRYQVFANLRLLTPRKCEVSLWNGNVILRKILLPAAYEVFKNTTSSTVIKISSNDISHMFSETPLSWLPVAC